MTRTYPPLDLPTLRNVRIIQRLLAGDPDYFGDACPYPPEVASWFKRSDAPTETARAPATSVAELQTLEVEVEELLKQLKSLKNSMNANTSQKEELEYIKAAAGLLDKLISIKERASHIADVEEFKRTILSLLADVMTPEQRTEFMDKLGK